MMVMIKTLLMIDAAMLKIFTMISMHIENGYRFTKSLVYSLFYIINKSDSKLYTTILHIEKKIH